MLSERSYTENTKYPFVPFIGNPRKEKSTLSQQTADQWLPGLRVGKSHEAQRGQRAPEEEQRHAGPACGGGHVTVHSTLNPLNCALKTVLFYCV